MSRKSSNGDRKPFRDINLRFINILDELKKRKEISTYTDFAVNINQNKQGIQDIKAANKSLSVHTLRLLKTIFPTINLDYIIMGGEEEMFINPEKENKSGKMEYLIDKIAEQAEEIGRLKEMLYKKESGA